MKTVVEAVVAAMLVMGFSMSSASAADVQAAKKSIQDALASAQNMVSHGKQGHMDAMTEHAENFIKHAKSALENIPADNEHGEEVVSHLKTAIAQAEDAIEHGEAGHSDVAMKHAQATLFNAKEAQSHAGAL
jgi:ribosomal protein S20